ncbi:MAG: ATP-binding protein [Planctomycetota bacterium]
MRYFNTAGPCSPKLHYMVPAAERLPEAQELVQRGHYFVVHAPRQTGKTTTLRALAEKLTAGGKFAALHFSCESGEPGGDNYGETQQAILGEIRIQAENYLPLELRPPEVWPAAPDLLLVRSALSAWARTCPRPLILIFDEIDALRGESLRSVLRQLRAGYPDRPTAFPHSVVLCGLRDVRDYKAASGGDPVRLGTSSPFNIKVESMRLGNFTLEEMRGLLAQHEAEAGQPFVPGTVEKVFDLTAGQPWLVNALAREVIEKMKVIPPTSITAEHVEEAKERLILARATHLDSLVARLEEPRVRRVIEPLLTGSLEGITSYEEDFAYVRDLGLVAADGPVRIANPIYREVIVRVLALPVERKVDAEARSFVGRDGRLDLDRLLEEFRAFWAEHGEALAAGIAYPEVAPQLVLMAYLQRVVNGGGYVDREYGVGRGRIDLLIRWPYRIPSGEKRWQREAMELKVWRPGRGDPVQDGLGQLEGYLERLELEHGYLVVFDRRGMPEKTETGPGRGHLVAARGPKGRAITVMVLPGPVPTPDAPLSGG